MKKKNYLVPGIVAGILVLLYMLMPLDMIPDFFSGIGQVDDVMVLIAGIIYEIANLIGASNARRSARQSASSSYEEDRKREFGSYKEL